MSVLAEFEAWMAGAGIRLTDAIKLVSSAPGCSGLALGVQAARTIGEGEQLCTIPKAACLSIRTTELADVIEAEQLGGGLGLVLAVLHEKSLGEASKWHGYLRALPPREYLPLFWSDEQLALLQGTELESKVQADREAAGEDFAEHVLPLLARYPARLRHPGFITLHNFQVAAAYVASRAFGVDEWHGDAMVPLADIFNHKASVVELADGYEVHGAEGSDSDSGGGDGEEEEEEEDNGEGAGGDADSGSSDEEEGAGEVSGSDTVGHQHQHRHRLDHQHHAGCSGGHSHGEACGAAGRAEAPGHGGGGALQALPAVMGSRDATIYGLKTANGLHLGLQMAIVDRDEETLEIVTPSGVPAGQEVHNTYGELGNAELVKKYGFALRQNPFTAVSLDKARLLAAAAGALGAQRWRQCSRILEEQTELLDEEEEPFEALPNGHISAALFVALRVLCTTEKEAAGWVSFEDALKLPPASAAAAAAADAGAAGLAGGQGGAGAGGQPELGAVQVWGVRDGNGQPLEAAAAAAAASEAQQGGYASLLNASMCQLLQGEVRQRLAAYAGTLQEDLQQLQEQQQGAAAAAETAGAAASQAESEQQVAERAALVLRITEKEVLHDLLAALERRLASLPAEQPAPAKAGGGRQRNGSSGQKRKQR